MLPTLWLIAFSSCLLPLSTLLAVLSTFTSMLSEQDYTIVYYNTEGKDTMHMDYGGVLYISVLRANCYPPPPQIHDIVCGKGGLWLTSKGPRNVHWV